VTNPSTSPENFPLAPGNDRFFDEVTGSMSPGTTLVAGSTIDMQILRDLFAGVAEASAALGVDPELREELLETRPRLAPMQVNRRGELQEWLDDWDQREASHRHISHLCSAGSPGTAGPRRGRRPRGHGSGTVGMRWREGRLVEATVLSTLGGACRLRAGADLRVTRDGRPARTTRPEPGIVEIDTAPGATYVVVS